MTPKSAYLARPKMLQPWLKIDGSGPGHFSIGPKAGLNPFNSDKFGNKISGIRCSTNFTMTISLHKQKEKSYYWKTCFSTTPKNMFFAYKTRATDARVTKELIWIQLRFIELRAKFQPNRFSQSREISFWKKKVLVFLYIYKPGY